MNANSPLTEALLAAATVAIFLCGLFLLLYRIVVWARRQKKRAYIIGAALAPFIALGNVGDPDFRIVNEAKRLKNREEDDSGDPPETEDERIVRAAAEIAAKKRENAVRKDEVLTIPTKPIRPALVWVISIALGLTAGITSLVLAWLLLADPALLDPRARFARESLSAFDWGSLFAMSAMLLTSMVMFFRLRKSSVYLFGAYLAVGILGSAWYATTAPHEPYFDLRVTSFSGIPAAIAVLGYMLWLKKRALLA